MNRLQRIRRIAKNVRKWAEELRSNTYCWDDSLSCMCGIASYELLTRLQRAGIPAQLCLADDSEEKCAHMFIKSSGYVVDVTATQFSHYYDHPKVCIVRSGKAFKKAWYWRPFRATRDKDEIVSWQHDWPWQQLHPIVFSRLLEHGSDHHEMQELSERETHSAERYMPGVYRSRLATHRGSQ